MKVWAISDTHFNHANIATYCDRPADFTERIVKNCKRLIKPEDLVLHFGDVFIGKLEGWLAIRKELVGHWVLVPGNHDGHSNVWWMRNGFDFAADSMTFRRCFITHKPARELPPNADLNLFGHLHNIWDGFHANDPKAMKDEHGETYISQTGKLWHPWQRLFALEYTNYCPVEFDKFVSHPDKFNARGPNGGK
jgi:calcineurin-like phosphoesterase family protein